MVTAYFISYFVLPVWNVFTKVIPTKIGNSLVHAVDFFVPACVRKNKTDVTGQDFQRFPGALWRPRDGKNKRS